MRHKEKPLENSSPRESWGNLFLDGPCVLQHQDNASARGKRLLKLSSHFERVFSNINVVILTEAIHLFIMLLRILFIYYKRILYKPNTLLFGGFPLQW